MMEWVRELRACVIMVVIMLRSLQHTHYIMAERKGTPAPQVYLNGEKWASSHYKSNHLVSQIIGQSVNQNCPKRKLSATGVFRRTWWRITLRFHWDSIN